MSKKHFTIIAAVVKEMVEACEPDSPELVTVAVLAAKLADQFMRVNPRFNRELFLESCGF